MSQEDKDRYRARRDAGMCVGCGKVAPEHGKVRCSRCLKCGSGSHGRGLKTEQQLAKMTKDQLEAYQKELNGTSTLVDLALLNRKLEFTVVWTKKGQALIIDGITLDLRGNKEFHKEIDAVMQKKLWTSARAAALAPADDGGLESFISAQAGAGDGDNPEGPPAATAHGTD